MFQPTVIARRALLASLMVAVLACDSNGPSSPSATSLDKEPPNIILYLIDTLRVDHLGAFGYARATSPNIDELVAKGVVFDPAYSQDSRTLGSVVSLLTSLHTPSHGITNFGHRIQTSVVTLAEVLSRAGYETGSFITNVNAGQMPGLDRGFRHFHDAARSYRERDAVRSLPEEALFEWIDTLGGSTFFAYVHTAEPHRPYIPPPPYDAMFDPDYEGPTTGYFEGPDGYGQASSQADIDHVKALYDGEISFADAAFRRFLDGLEARGLRERTLIVLTSDHGEELSDRGGWNHGHSLYNELIRVPLLFAGAGLPAGRRIAAPAQLVDVAPTILDIAGVPSPESFEGESLLGVMQGRDAERFADRDVFSMTTSQTPHAAIIQRDWKAILAADGVLELYDLRRDPGELHDLASSEPERAARLRERIETLSYGGDGWAAPQTYVPLSEEQVERLRALGYIE